MTTTETTADARYREVMDRLIDRAQGKTEGEKLEELLGPLSLEARQELGSRAYTFIASATGELFAEQASTLTPEEANDPGLIEVLMQTCADFGALSGFLAGMEYQKLYAEAEFDDD